MDGLLGGLAVAALIAACVCAPIGGLLYRHEIVPRWRRLAARFSPPAEPVEGRPIERIARDARRLHDELIALAPGTPMARRAGIARAYDDLLAEACRALDVPDTLTGVAARRRDVERLRVEHELGRAGQRLDP